MKKNKSIKDIIDIRCGRWPSYYDECNAQDYYEYFIKGTNVKLGFKYVDGDTGEKYFYCIVCDGYDQMDAYDTEEDLFEHFDWMLNDKELIWRYYQ